MKRMSTATHGLIDYLVSGIVALLPKVGGYSKKVTMIMEGSAGMAAVYSAMTNYERGLVKVLPMKAHLTLDALSGGALIGAAAMLDDEPTAVRATLLGIGVFEIFAALSTRTKSMNEIAQESRRAVSARGGSTGDGRSRMRDDRGRFIPRSRQLANA